MDSTAMSGLSGPQVVLIINCTREEPENQYRILGRPRVLGSKGSWAHVPLGPRAPWSESPWVHGPLGPRYLGPQGS